MVREKQHSNRSWNYKAYSVYLALIVVIAILTLISVGFYFETGGNYLLIFIGGFVSGLTGVIVVMAQDIQRRMRFPRVFFHSWHNPKLFNVNEKKLFPFILRNRGHTPGQDILVLATVRCYKGTALIGNEDWKDVTISNVTPSNERVYKYIEERLIYPKIGETGERDIGRITIEPELSGDYDIEVYAEVYERNGMTKRKCRFTGDRLDCDPEKHLEFHSYY